MLLTTGDMLDLSSNAEVSAPAGEFTYMLAESLLEDVPSVTAAAALMPENKVSLFSLSNSMLT